MPPRQARRVKLIRPELQLRLIGSFLGLITVSLVLQFCVLWRFLARAAAEIETAGGPLTERVLPMLVGVLVTCLAVVLPVVVAFGILLTFRIAGPIHHFEQFLSAVARGEQVEPCRLRADDELHRLCEAMNGATENERRRAAERPEQGPRRTGLAA